MKPSTRRVLRLLGTGLLVSTVSLAWLGYAAVTSVKQAISRIGIDGDALGKVMQDAVLLTLREGTPQQKLELIASFADVPAESASYARPLLEEASRDQDSGVSRAARAALRRLPTPANVNGGEFMRIPRISVRGMMAINAGAGVTLWLGGTAWLVHRDHEDQIVHMMQDRESGALSLSGHSLPPSFWPHYRRTLLGQPWPGDYPCACRMHPNPSERELASAADSASLNPVFNRISAAYRKTREHKGAVESLGASNAWDEKRVRDLDAQVKELANKGELLHGSERVRKAFLDTIAVNRKSLEEHERLYRIYHAAAISPTILTDPEIVYPER